MSILLGQSGPVLDSEEQHRLTGGREEATTLSRCVLLMFHRRRQAEAAGKSCTLSLLLPLRPSWGRSRRRSRVAA